MSALRQRMREDLHIRNYSPQTIDCSLRCVAQFAQYFRTPPDRLGPEHIRQYQVYLVQEKRVSWSIVMQTVCALRFLYRITLGQPGMIAYIPQPKQPMRPSNGFSHNRETARGWQRFLTPPFTRPTSKHRSR